MSDDRYRVIDCDEHEIQDVLNHEHAKEWKLIQAIRGGEYVDLGQHKRRWTLILEDDGSEAV